MSGQQDSDVNREGETKVYSHELTLIVKDSKLQCINVRIQEVQFLIVCTPTKACILSLQLIL